MTKPTLPQGTRDFGPEVIRKRNFIFKTIRDAFELYGFQPLETPAMENIDTLMGKYGEEGDKLIFKILNNGLERPEKHDQAKQEFNKILQGKTIKGITERALRYDLTIPFARYVAMNHGQLTYPFKRYQIQPVWRADKPQRGRYREFYQCDADVVGSTSLWNEVELSNLYNEVFLRLGIIKYELRINSRKILAALAERCGGTEKMMEITIAIDKLDKIGMEKVKEELRVRNVNNEQISVIEEYLNISGNNKDKLERINRLLGQFESGRQGIDEISFVIQNFEPGKTDSRLEIDFTLARGLNYYTGIIFEAKAPSEIKIGSIGGGGRYDDLTGLFGVPGIPGVGISFGVDRIYDVMEEMDLFPLETGAGTQVLFFNLGEAESRAAFSVMQKLRSRNISCELFHENAKFDKQFKYADKKNVLYVVIIGSKELEEKTCVIKNLRTGQQESVPIANLENVLFI